MSFPSISVILISGYLDQDLIKRAVKEGLRQLSFVLERKQLTPYHRLIYRGDWRGIRPSSRRAGAGERLRVLVPVARFEALWSAPTELCNG
jgi:hypothetical protein